MFDTVYGLQQFGLSFELFPPRSDSGDRALLQHVEQLMQFQPSYVTCTYGAAGSTRAKTLDVVTRVKEQFGVPVASHLTCVGATQEDLRSYLIEAERRGIDAVVALRGDPPEGEDHFQAVPGGLQYANELVALIRGEFPQFGVAVAGYPETHREAESPAADLENLKRKVETGADVVITQLFYDQQDFFRFRDRYFQAGIKVPLVPGILPVTNLAQIKRISTLCGARLPEAFVTRLAQRDDPEWQFQVGVDFAVEQVQALLDGAVAGLHFYVLNKSQATCQLLQRVTLPQTRTD